MSTARRRALEARLAEAERRAARRAARDRAASGDDPDPLVAYATMVATLADALGRSRAETFGVLGTPDDVREAVEAELARRALAARPPQGSA